MIIYTNSPAKEGQKTWHYKGVQNDENYTVSCDDCEKGARCADCIHNEKLDETLQDTIASKLSDRFFPLVSCAYCSYDSCFYRWDYPC
jgi:hypothetical protein